MMKNIFQLKIITYTNQRLPATAQGSKILPYILCTRKIMIEDFL